ncbi:MAG: response regulator [Bacteroidales bacterium]|nr:response regulator [Bacteroidales bacterium]
MPEITPENTHSKNNSILIAEDDTSNFLLLKVYLKNAKYDILHAHDGQEAIDMVTNNTPVSLILMDIKMPIKNGFQAVKEIKVYKPDIPIIALTAYAMSGDRDKALKAGFDEYIAKPVSKDDLFELISKYISISKTNN